MPTTPTAGGQARASRGKAAAQLPPELSRPIATTHDGRDITRPWVRELEEARDPKLLASADWGVYDRVLLDGQVKSCMEQRIRAVVSREWNVQPGDENDPRSVEAAAELDKAIERIGWDNLTEKMLYAILFGYSVAELFWKPIDGKLAWDQIRVRHARRFRYDQNGKLRLLTRANMRGELLPDRKFWVVKSGGTDDDEAYGRGLAEWLYFPVLFKRNGIRFWNIALDKFSVPTTKGVYPRGSSQDDIDKLLASLQAIANDSGFVIPEGMDVSLLQMAQQGADFGAVCRYMDGEIAKIILSQTMTTDNGSSRSQADVHADVKLEVVKADADLLADAFASGPSRWFTDFNYGPEVACPRVMRIVEEEDDLKEAAETDEVLDRVGWVRTEASFRDRYGDGYVRKETLGTTKPGKGKEEEPADLPGNVIPIRAPAFAATDPRPLYVYRQLKNVGDVNDWARSQGFKTLVPGSDLHTTITYSRRPVNWYRVAGEFTPDRELIVDAGGPRMVDRLGDQGAVVLHFWSGPLAWRNQVMRDLGASWDFPEYLPHVTLTYDGGDLDLSKIEPYRGKLIFGPEIFEPIEEEWNQQILEVSLAEPGAPRDIVDDAVDTIMADEGWRDALAPMVDPLLTQIQGAASRDDVLEILRREAELDGDGTLAESLARAGFGLRIDALTGDEEG